MKYGAIFYKDASNIGDDIQSYAALKFLPSCDYFLDREHLDEFCSSDGEKVAVLLNGWYMHSHMNWPPSPFIYPKIVGFHLDTYHSKVYGRNTIENHFLEGASAHFF